MAINSKVKGAAGERELAELFKKKGLTARRTQQYCGAAGDSDVVCDELPFLHIESKRTERLSLYDAMEQATRDAKIDHLPAVFHRKNKKPWVVILDAEKFLDILKELNQVESRSQESLASSSQ